jgi:hypothetical protein
MLYTAAITVPAGTTEAAPVKTNIKCAGGILYFVSVLFPAGVNALAHTTLWRGSHQFIPSTQGMNLTGDGETVTINAYEVLAAETNVVALKSWNDDDTYEHILYVRIAVEREDVLAFGTIQSRIPELVRKVLTSRTTKKSTT